MKVVLHLNTPDGPVTADVDDELSIGRTDLARLVVNDSGLSRKNTTVFIDGDEVFLADENSLNGTFLNGEKISGTPRKLADGDRIRIGSGTTIKVVIEKDSRQSFESRSMPSFESPVSSAGTTPHDISPGQPVYRAESPTRSGPPVIAIAAVAMTLLVLVFGGAALYFLLSDNEPPRPGTVAQTISAASAIPVRVIDPLGGEDEDDLDDLIASWEVAEEEIKAENVADVSVDSTDTEDQELNVTAALLADRQKKAFEPRSGETGIRPAGLAVPKELFGDGVIKQKAKLREMKTAGYHQPLDFAELAEKRLSRALIEMPMAAQSFYLDVGGSAPDGPFKSFTFQGGSVDIPSDSPKFEALVKLASNFAGHKYDLNNSADRKQMRMRLLRMFNPRAKPILKKLADGYFQKFGRPLRVTSLTRSMDYQVLLNQGNANSFKVRDENSLPPHTSGCAFDLARKHMNAEEQNFVMQELAEMEKAGLLDALIEYGTNACFHVFIYDDAKPPRM